MNISLYRACAVFILTLNLHAAVKFNYPRARCSKKCDDYHGIKVSDPYRWLEALDSQESREWIDAENKLTKDYLATISQRPKIKERLKELWNYERSFTPTRAGKIYIYAKNDGLQNQNVLYKMSKINGPSELFFDPNKLSEDGTIALGSASFTYNGALWAYGLSRAGSDRTEWYVKDVETGKDLQDRLAPNFQGGVSWLRDNSGFFYVAFPEATKGRELEEAVYFAKLYFHEIGTPQSDDVVIYERPDNKEYVPSGKVSEDGRWLIITVQKGTEHKNMVYLKDLTKKDAPLLPLVTNLEQSYAFIGNDGSILYFLTDRDATRGKIVKIDVQPEHPFWSDIVATSPDTLTKVTFIDDLFVLNYLKDAHSFIKIYKIDGTFVRDVKLPGIGTVTGFSGKRADTETFYEFSSFNTPSTIYHYAMKTGKSTVFRKSKVKFDENDYVVKQVFYKSKDGTRIPMFLTYKKGLKRDGKNPTILYGYGGFARALTPVFSTSRAVWLEMGGILAVANIRGGSEYGKKWWEEGSRLKKQNVFDDFIAGAEWLIQNNYTCSKKLAIEGHSNGGLLVGAVLNQRPDLFGAAIPIVGVMDMVRFDKFTIGYQWKSDYGSPDESVDFKALYAYSPYHNVKYGTRYPAVLATTADHDDRVFPAHSFKYIAAMQAAQAGNAPILIRIDTKTGHGAGKSITKVIEENADIYAFLFRNLRMEKRATMKTDKRSCTKRC